MNRATRLWSIIVGWTGLFGGPACQSTEATPAPRPAQQPPVVSVGPSETSEPRTPNESPPPREPVEALTGEARIQRAMAELATLHAQGAISDELWRVRWAALEREQKARRQPELSQLVTTKPWRQLEALWRQVQQLERRAVRAKDEQERKAIYEQADGLLKTVRDHKSVIGRMKADGLLTDAEHLLLYSILGSRLDQLAASHAPFSCYDRSLPDYERDRSAQLEQARVKLAELHAFRVAGVIDEPIYQTRKQQLEQTLAAQQGVPRPTGRAALILAALAGVKPHGRPAQPTGRVKHQHFMTCYEI